MRRFPGALTRGGLLVVLIWPSVAGAQWLNVPRPAIPRTAD